jgi:2,5-diketo-D-gluconate reductase A
VFDFKLSGDDMNSIATLDTKESLFFDHRDPKMVATLSSFKLNDEAEAAGESK